MYAIYRYNRRAVKTLFNSYEEARQQARKLARKLIASSAYPGFFRRTPDGSQPVVSDTPYSVRKVA